MNTFLVPFNEVVGAIAGNRASAEEIALFAKDPKGVLASQLDLQTEATFSVVENSNEEVHLALPYYTGVEELQAQILADDSIADISGGEIVISICAVLASAAAIALGVSVPGAVIIGGLTAGIAVGTTVLAGVAVGVDRHVPEGK